MLKEWMRLILLPCLFIGVAFNTYSRLQEVPKAVHRIKSHLSQHLEESFNRRYS